MNRRLTKTSRLTALLEEERKLLLQGQLNSLPDLLERKRVLVEELRDSPPEDLSALHALMARNHVLLGSAMAGIRRVTDRLDALRRMRLSLETYDSKGHRQSLGTSPTGTMEKRA